MVGKVLRVGLKRFLDMRLGYMPYSARSKKGLKWSLRKVKARLQKKLKEGRLRKFKGRGTFKGGA